MYIAPPSPSYDTAHILPLLRENTQIDKGDFIYDATNWKVKAATGRRGGRREAKVNNIRKGVLILHSLVQINGAKIVCRHHALKTHEGCTFL